MYQSKASQLKEIMNKDFPVKYAYNQGITINSLKFTERLSELDKILTSIGIKYAFVDENVHNVAHNQSWQDINILINKHFQTLDLDDQDPKGEKIDKYYDDIEKYEEQKLKVNRFNIASLLENIDPRIQSIFSELQELIIPEENIEMDLIRETKNTDAVPVPEIMTSKITDFDEPNTSTLDPAIETLVEIKKPNSEEIQPKRANDMLQKSIAQKVSELKLLVDELISDPAEYFEFKNLSSQDPNKSMAWLVSKENTKQIKLINQFIDLYLQNTLGNSLDSEEKRMKKLCLDIRHKQKEVDKLAITLLDLNKRFIWHIIKRIGGGLDIGKANDTNFEQPAGNTLLSYEDIYSMACLQFYNSIFNKATDGPYKDYSLLTYVGSRLQKLITEMGQNSSLIRLPQVEVEKINKFRRSELEVLQSHPSIQKNSSEYYELVIKSLESKISKSNKDIIDILYIQQIQKNANIVKVRSTDMPYPSGNSDDEFGLHMEKYSFPEPIDKESDSPEKATDFDLLRNNLLEVLNTLSPRERDVLTLRFGLDDGQAKELSRVGEVFNVGRERIRQLEASALRKLRHPNRYGPLKDFLR
jgi:RNA polymerase sigma factor (sigma-70 family)